MSERMYHENIGSLNPFVGCLHNCVYCKPSFQRQAKRQKNRCLECYTFKPHFHSERLKQSPPKTKENEFVFFPSMGDIRFAQHRWVEAMLSYIMNHPKTTFLVQTKDPGVFYEHRYYMSNIIFGITLETDQSYFYDTPSRYHDYSSISDAPQPFNRFCDFLKLDLPIPKAVTIEPILDFRLEDFLHRIEAIKPKFVYVGYDNHDCFLPEPSLERTQGLIKRLSEFTEVRTKLLRKAWWEKP